MLLKCFELIVLVGMCFVFLFEVILCVCVPVFEEQRKSDALLFVLCFIPHYAPLTHTPYQYTLEVKVCKITPGFMWVLCGDLNQVLSVFIHRAISSDWSSLLFVLNAVEFISLCVDRLLQNPSHHKVDRMRSHVLFCLLYVTLLWTEKCHLFSWVWPMTSSRKTVKGLLCLMWHLGLHEFLYICIPHNASESYQQQELVKL